MLTKPQHVSESPVTGGMFLRTLRAMDSSTTSERGS